MRIAVVIPSLNEQARIAAAIQSARSAGASEVIVADGGSQDQTLEIARRFATPIVRSTAGRALQMNSGASQAQGEVLLFLHADCQLPIDACQQIENALADPNVAWGAFRQRINAPQKIYRAIEWGNAARLRWQSLAYGDQAIFVRTETFWTIGGFDPVPLLEDVLLSRKLARQTPPVILPGPVVVDARHWEKNGPLRQTLRNWGLMARFRCGASPERLAKSLG